MNTSFPSNAAVPSDVSASNTVSSKDPQRRYVVPMFPYPSGTLHMGHARNYAIADAIARAERMKGHEVLFPIGWDAFGLPAENAAIEKGVAPSTWTRANIATMKASLQRMGFSFDWEREIATCDPETYRFSQLFFVQMLKADFIYRSETAVSWDPMEKTVLAREQVVDGRGWRSGAVVEERVIPSWTARVTAFADELIDGFEALDWPEAAKAIGRSWIGREEDGTFRLHDWNLSRQRYWGCPVPIVECGACGPVPVPEEQLPVVLPEDVRLTEPGNPLEHMNAWRACACPDCGRTAQRSIETLDTFFDSSWYFLRYPSVGEPGSEQVPMVPSGAGWAPVDHYVGGIEHASMHLIYARFFSKALRAMGYGVPDEPFKKLTAQGLVCAPVFFEATEQGERPIAPSDVVRAKDGTMRATISGRPVREARMEKMSKSKKNGQTIDAILAAGHSPDAVRFALHFAGPFAKSIDWTDQALASAEKAIRRIEVAGQAAHAMVNDERDDAVERATRAFVRRSIGEFERAEGLNITIGEGLGALGVFEKAVREGRGGRSVREGMMALCACFYPIVPETAQRAARFIDPAWDAIQVGFPSVVDEPSTMLVVQANGRFVEACEAPAFEHEKDVVAWVFERCEGLARRVDPEQVSEIHWKPGRVINVVGAAPTMVDRHEQVEVATKVRKPRP